MGFDYPFGANLPIYKELTMQQERLQLDIEHLLFELNCCINNLSRYRLNINRDDLQQAELRLNKLESLISFYPRREITPALAISNVVEYAAFIKEYGQLGLALLDECSIDDAYTMMGRRIFLFVKSFN